MAHRPTEDSQERQKDGDQTAHAQVPGSGPDGGEAVTKRGERWKLDDDVFQQAWLELGGEDGTGAKKKRRR